METALLISLVGLAGVVIGASISFFVNWRIMAKEIKLRIIEKVFERRGRTNEILLKVLNSFQIIYSS